VDELQRDISDACLALLVTPWGGGSVCTGHEKPFTHRRRFASWLEWSVAYTRSAKSLVRHMSLFNDDVPFTLLLWRWVKSDSMTKKDGLGRIENEVVVTYCKVLSYTLEGGTRKVTVYSLNGRDLQYVPSNTKLNYLCAVMCGHSITYMNNLILGTKQVTTTSFHILLINLLRSPWYVN
jgi:hypothetical protein